MKRSNFALCGLVLLTLLLGTAQGVQAQEKERQKRFAIKINPLSLFVLTVNLKTELRVNPRMSTCVTTYYGGISTGVGAGETADGKIYYKVAGVAPEFRFYLSKEHKAPEGFYVGPYTRFRNIKTGFGAQVFDPDSNQSVDADVEYSSNSFAGGFMGGYQAITDFGFLFDAWFGFGWGTTSRKATVTCLGCDGDETFDESVGFGGKGPNMRSGIAIGFAF